MAANDVSAPRAAAACAGGSGGALEQGGVEPVARDVVQVLLKVGQPLVAPRARQLRLGPGIEECVRHVRVARAVGRNRQGRVGEGVRISQHANNCAAQRSTAGAHSMQPECSHRCSAPASAALPRPWWMGTAPTPPAPCPSRARHPSTTAAAAAGRRPLMRRRPAAAAALPAGPCCPAAVREVGRLAAAGEARGQAALAQQPQQARHPHPILQAQQARHPHPLAPRARAVELTTAATDPGQAASTRSATRRPTAPSSASPSRSLAW